MKKEELEVMKTQVSELLRRNLIPKKLRFIADSFLKMGEDYLAATEKIEDLESYLSGIKKGMELRRIAEGK